MDPRVLVCAQRGRGHILQQNRAVSFRVPALNHPVSMCAHGDRGHILQQNRAVLFVWLL